MIDLPPERPGYAAPPVLAPSREGIAKAIAAGTWRTDPPAEEVLLGNVRALRFRAQGTARATVLHFHGGGYRLGCPEMIGPYATALAANCGVDVICPAYRLAPENPFPAGLNDARNIFIALRERGAGPIILSGDSAGGGLAASLTILAVAMAVVPAGLVLLSPWLDLTVTSTCYASNAATDPWFSHSSATTAAELYLQGMSARDPLVSPVLACVAGFPPGFISTGSGEVLLDDSRRFHAALREAGVASTLLEVPGMEHVAVTRGMALAGAAECFSAVSSFINQILEPH